MNDLQRLAALRASHIPPYAYSANFDTANMQDLRARITSREVLDASIPKNFYLQAVKDDKNNMRRVCLGVALLAKALCIKKVDVVHVHLAGLLRETRMAEMDREQRAVNPVLSRIGKGYIACADFLEYKDVEAKYGYHATQLAADYLIEHVERGGGLILGATAIQIVEATQYGSAFASMLSDSFESYRIL